MLLKYRGQVHSGLMHFCPGAGVCLSLCLSVTRIPHEWAIPLIFLTPTVVGERPPVAASNCAEETYFKITAYSTLTWTHATKSSGYYALCTSTVS